MQETQRLPFGASHLEPFVWDSKVGSAGACCQVAVSISMWAMSCGKSPGLVVEVVAACATFDANRLIEILVATLSHTSYHYPKPGSTKVAAGGSRYDIVVAVQLFCSAFLSVKELSEACGRLATWRILSKHSS